MTGGEAVAGDGNNGSTGVQSTDADDRRDGIIVARRLVTTVAILAVIGTVVALVLVNRMGAHYVDALEVASDGAEVAALSAASGASIANDLVALTDTANEALTEVEAMIEVTVETLDSVGTAMDTNLANGFVGAASVVDGLASFIETIERFIPGDNSDSLAEQMRTLADGLEPVPDQLHELGNTLQTAATTLAGTTDSVDDLQVQLDALSSSIGEAQQALVQVEASAEALSVKADQAIDNSGGDLWLVRILVIVMGAGIALSCLAARRTLGSIAARHALAGGTV